ncbi:acyl-CoA dehydrogenase, partial [Acinetobacter guillouiae]|nr:acyl-CoA dehydrogenase [Acinetobacter guillouiae]
GHGYIREWGMDQCVRDLRIAHIYAGTKGVQSQDLIGRKTIKFNGEFIAEYIEEFRDFANGLDTDFKFIKDSTLDIATEVDM